MDLRASTNFGVSNGKLGLEFLLPSSAYILCAAIYIGPRVDLGVLLLLGSGGGGSAVVVVVNYEEGEREREREREQHHGGYPVYS